MYKIFVSLVILWLLLGACKQKPAKSPTMRPPPTATTQNKKPEPAVSLLPAPSGYIDKDYYSILLPPTLEDSSNINWWSIWSDEVYDYKLGLELFIPFCLNTDRLPEMVGKRLKSDGSVDLFIVPPEHKNSPEFK